MEVYNICKASSNASIHHFDTSKTILISVVERHVARNPQMNALPITFDVQVFFGARATIELIVAPNVEKFPKLHIAYIDFVIST